jgi:hypothetical protein
MTSPAPTVYHVRLDGQSAEPGWLLGSCVGADPGQDLIAFLSHDVSLTAPSVTGASLRSVQRLRGHSGTILRMNRMAPSGQVLLERPGAPSLDLTPPPDQTGWLAGADCIISILNGEPVEQIADWLDWHARHHGMTGALLFNRLGESGASADLAERLKGRDTPWLAVIVVVDLAMPVGHPDLPEATHRLQAPNAPGKDRIARPPNDRWRSPVLETVLLEMGRWRFLRMAGTVCHLDPSDYLAPNGQTVFEAARASQSGAVGLIGQPAYAWSVAGDTPAVPGDHICRPFDIDNRFLRWCVVPEQPADPERIWRPHRVIGATLAARPDLALYRFMGLRHPACKPAEIIPKSSLTEDPALLALSETHFNHKPQRVPEKWQTSDISLDAAVPENPKITLVTAMKNEGPFLLEWIAYHRTIGATDFLVYTNDCTDGTDHFLDLLQTKGLVQHRDNPFRKTPGLKPQHAALQAAEHEKVVREADWILVSDVDEFVAIHTGDGSFRALFEVVGNVHLISLTWRLFGNADIAQYKDDFIIRQFTSCAAKMANKPHQAWGFKTLYRNNGVFRKLGVHRPKGIKGALADKLRWVNGSGVALPKREFRNAWRSSAETVGYDLVTLNHYAVRSAESFLVKRDRGRVNHTDRDQGRAYWFRMNHNTTEDHSIQRMLPALEAEWARLMADPEIAAAHHAAVAAHRAKIAELRARPDYEAFFADLTGHRLSRLSRMLPHFGANVFLSGPDSVPDELLDQELEENFYFTVDAPVEALH